jgi:hypothetical protein
MPRPEFADRLDFHNSQIDQYVAAARLCGLIDLRTGLTCALPVRHRGACRLVPRMEARYRAEAQPR